MTRDINTVGLHATAMVTEPTFNVAFRGYDKHEVDQYAQLIEAHVATTAAERQELRARVRGLLEQLQQAHMEIIELRRRPAINDKITFRHLGPRVEHILAEAEAQADEILHNAAEILSEERRAAERDLLAAQAEHAQQVRDFYAGLDQRRAEVEQELTRRRDAANTDLSHVQAYVYRLREEADAVLAEAHHQAQQVAANAATAAERTRADSIADGQLIRMKAEEDAAGLAANAETYARHTRQAAEQHAQETRAAAELYAQQARSAAEQAATLVRTQAEEHATQVRSAAEEHAARLHTSLSQPARHVSHEERPADAVTPDDTFVGLAIMDQTAVADPVPAAADGAGEPETAATPSEDPAPQRNGSKNPVGVVSHKDGHPNFGAGVAAARTGET